MREETEKEVQEFILAELRDRGGDVDNKNMEENFIESGVIDSFGFLELLVAIEQKFNVQINFAELDPESFTNLSGLTFHCVESIISSSAS